MWAVHVQCTVHVQCSKCASSTVTVVIKSNQRRYYQQVWNNPKKGSYLFYSTPYQLVLSQRIEFRPPSIIPWILTMRLSITMNEWAKNWLWCVNTSRFIWNERNETQLLVFESNQWNLPYANVPRNLSQFVAKKDDKTSVFNDKTLAFNAKSQQHFLHITLYHYLTKSNPIPFSW